MHAKFEIYMKALWWSEQIGVKLPKHECQWHQHYFFILCHGKWWFFQTCFDTY
jgi:hypothetical protein